MPLFRTQIYAHLSFLAIISKQLIAQSLRAYFFVSHRDRIYIDEQTLADKGKPWFGKFLLARRRSKPAENGIGYATSIYEGLINIIAVACSVPMLAANLEE